MALAIVLVFLFMLSKQRWRALFIIGLTAYIGWMALPEEQIARFTTMGDDKTSQARLVLWEDARNIISQNQWIGIGYENWMPYYRTNFVRNADEIHNTILESFVEIGVPGGSIFISLILFSLLTNCRSRKNFMNQGVEGQLLGSMALGLNLALVGALIAAQFMSVLFYPMFWLAFSQTSALNSLSLQYIKSENGNIKKRLRGK